MVSRVVEPFGQDGVWLRCALHNHTTESDGMLDPFMLRRYYTLGSFDVLAVTDHDRLTAPPELADRGPTTMLLPGTEISLRAPVSGGPLHLVALGVREMPAVTLADSLATAVAAVSAAGGVSLLAHPWWSGLLPEELGRLDGIAALEVYNGGCEVEQSRGFSGQYWDALLAQGIRINAVATDDHHLPGFNAFHGWTMVRAAERTPEAVLAALRAGHYYATCGPVIRALRWEDDELVVETSPVRSIAAIGPPPFGARINAGTHGLTLFGRRRMTDSGVCEGVIDGELLTYARFPRQTGASFVRVELIDALGRYAWSNPIWLDEQASG